jgi:hypothetical protein
VPAVGPVLDAAIRAVLAARLLVRGVILAVIEVPIRTLDVSDATSLTLEPHASPDAARWSRRSGIEVNAR